MSAPGGFEGLNGGQTRRLELLVELLGERGAPTSVADPERAWKVHIADSLSGIGPGGLQTATRVADLGAGAGLPGLVLAIALPQLEVEMIESVGRKAAFIDAAIGRLQLENARAIAVRAETWAVDGGRERYDAVTARAVARLATLAELASPLLVADGALVCWKGRRDPDEERELGRAAAALAMEPVDIAAVGPYAGSRNRHIHTLRKNGPTPAALPRRPGMAKKRPFGAEPGSRESSSEANK